MESIQWQRKVPLRYEADVAVLGGGIAGVCAACAAAREEVSVILVERFAITGGNATSGGVGNWSGETRGQGAVFDEIIADQEAFGAITPYPGVYEHFSRGNRPFDHEILAVILQELLLRHGVKLLLHTRFADVMVKGQTITEAVVCGPSGPEALRAKVFIDCTGGADVAARAGFSCHQGRDDDHLQLPPSMMFFVRHLHEALPPQLPAGWFHPVRTADELPMTSLWPHGPQAQALKVKVPFGDNTDTEAFTDIEIRARRRMLEVLDYYQRQENRPWRFDHASPIIGLREGKRIVGDHVLSVDEVRQGCRFDDAVARGVFYLDGMKPDDDKRTYLLSKEEQIVPPYQIPLRSLIARDGDNLMMAGRCFSSDQLALSSARVMPTCAMMGQAAGMCAARAARENTPIRHVDPLEVRTSLEAHGAQLEG